MGGVLASGEKYNQEGREIVGRVGRYSGQERKERIERYRSKRNQRNFHKKITVSTVPFHFFVIYYFSRYSITTT